MKMKQIRRILCAGMFTVLVLCCAAPAAALPSEPLEQNCVESYLVNTTSYSKGTYAAMTATERSEYRVPIRSTQAEHVKGATLSISIHRGYQYGLDAEKTFEVSVSGSGELNLEGLAKAAFSAELAVQFGIAYHADFETATEITYTLGNEKDPGYYRLAEAYPVMRVYLEVVGYDKNNVRNVLGSTSISYAPKLEGAYVTLEEFDPYAD